MTDAPCVHHFVIPPADGGTSSGVCRKCGERREFNNFVETGININLGKSRPRFVKHNVKAGD